MDVPSSKPKPKETAPDGLAEVERALSVLQGRHPESERMRREDEARRVKRLAEQGEAAKIESRRLRARRLALAAGASVLAVLAASGALVLRRELRRRARLEQAADPYRATGFVLVEASSLGEPSRLQVDVPAGCLLATSTMPTPARVRITHKGGSVEGPGPVLACLCEGGQVTVTGDTPPGEGIVLFRSDARALGGSRAFAFLPFEPGTTARADLECAEASLDAWLEAKSWQGSVEDRRRPRPATPADAPANDAWMAVDPRRAALREVGFRVAAFVEPGAPFSVIEVPAATCLLLVSDDPSGRASLRLKGGAIAVGPSTGGLAWCTAEPASVIAQRGGGGGAEAVAQDRAIAVLLGPAARVGGLFGLREVAERAGLPLGAASVPASDHGWDAKNLLAASAIPEALIASANAPDLGADPEARIVALSLEEPGALVAETPADVFSFCHPALDRSVDSLCAFSGPQKWRLDRAEARGGLARAKLPFWLFALQGVAEPAALKLQTELIALARRLRREEFEPTTIEAVTELDKGAEVLGRANEDAMVVLGLSPVEPWVFPYTDGPVWSVAGDPRVIPIKPLERVTVTSSTRTLPPKATRRTLVFRRQKR